MLRRFALSRPRAFPLVAFLLCASTGAGAQEPLSPRERAHHFLNRFTLGATPERIAEVERVGIDAWLASQMDRSTADDAALAARLRPLESIGYTSRALFARYVQPIPENATPEERRERQRLRDVPPRDLVDSVLLRAVYSRREVEEVAADFFRNHFCVAIDKGNVRYYATEYEREVICAGVFGDFGDLLRASARHPAMLVYLDNVLSRRAPTKAELKKIEMRVRLETKSRERGQEAAGIAAQRGLNENYARELLELHTLGVDNYYTQRDVENVAKALTGWTVSGDPKTGHAFQFQPAMHCEEDLVFLNRPVLRNEKDPEAEGLRILDLLAEHRGTARFLAWKLCRHFVRDDPPEDMVGRIAEVFRRSRGDLPSVYRAIVADEAFFARENYGAKFKRPFEFVVSALRVTGADVTSPQAIHAALQDMSEPLYLCKDPTGYYDQAEAWRDPGAFAVRWKFAMDLATGKLPGVAIPAGLYDDLRGYPPEAWRDRLAARLLPGGLAAPTALAIDRMVMRTLGTNPTPAIEDLAPRLVGLMLGSPEFQQQ